MHAVLFGFKRAFQATLRYARPLVARFGLTPARFDLLYVVHRYGNDVPQSTLRETLGVSAPVVSRMLDSLEDLGFVARKKHPDARRRIVELTEAGVRVIKRAIHAILGRNMLEFILTCVIRPSGSTTGPEARFFALCALDDALLTVYQGLGDTGAVSYPWQPDD